MLSVADGQRFGNKTSILLSGFYFLPFSSYIRRACVLGKTFGQKKKEITGRPLLYCYSYSILILFTDRFCGFMPA